MFLHPRFGEWFRKQRHFSEAVSQEEGEEGGPGGGERGPFIVDNASKQSKQSKQAKNEAKFCTLDKQAARKQAEKNEKMKPKFVP